GAHPTRLGVVRDVAEVLALRAARLLVGLPGFFAGALVDAPLALDLAAADVGLVPLLPGLLLGLGRGDGPGRGLELGRRCGGSTQLVLGARGGPRAHRGL